MPRLRKQTPKRPAVCSPTSRSSPLVSRCRHVPSAPIALLPRCPSRLAMLSHITPGPLPSFEIPAEWSSEVLGSLGQDPTRGYPAPFYPHDARALDMLVPTTLRTEPCPGFLSAQTSSPSPSLSLAPGTMPGIRLPPGCREPREQLHLRGGGVPV